MACIRLAPRWGFKRAGASIDTTTPAGKLIFGIFAALAEYERELIRERHGGLCLGAGAGQGRGRPFKMTPAKLRTAMAAMKHPETQLVNCAPNSDQPSDATSISPLKASYALWDRNCWIKENSDAMHGDPQLKKS